MSIFDKGGFRSKVNKIVKKLAEDGAAEAKIRYEAAIYDGNNDVSVKAEKTTVGYDIVASGESALFIEFGAGFREGYGHPQAEEFGYGPGTWSEGPEGKGHWLDKDGWRIPGTGQKTYGNPPSMAMYMTAKEVRRNVPRVASEVLHE